LSDKDPSTSSPIKREGGRPQRFQAVKGRPTAAQVLAIERAILNVATDQFLADGYNGTSMDAVAAAAGVSKGTLYSRYPDKEALFRAVVEHRVEAWSAEASKQNWNLGEGLEERLKHYAKLMMARAVSAESRAFDRLFNSAFDIIPEIGQMLHEMRYQRMYRYLTQEIRELTRADGRPARDPDKVASMLMVTLAGWTRLEMSQRTVSEREATDFGTHTVELLIAGRDAW